MLKTVTYFRVIVPMNIRRLQTTARRTVAVPGVLLVEFDDHRRIGCGRTHLWIKDRCVRVEHEWTTWAKR